MKNTASSTPRCRCAGLALVLGLAAAGASADDDRYGGRIMAYDVGTGTLLVDDRKAHVGPATKLLGYDGERIPTTALEPGMSVLYEVRRSDDDIPEIAVLELIPN